MRLGGGRFQAGGAWLVVMCVLAGGAGGVPRLRRRDVDGASFYGRGARRQHDLRPGSLLFPSCPSSARPATPLARLLHHYDIDRHDHDCSAFVQAPGDGHLYLQGQLFNFRAFNTPTLFQRNEYEVRDLLETVAGLGSPVTRTYTLQVANDAFQDGHRTPAQSHVIGWDSAANDWVYNESVWQQMDNVLALSREYGVKLIIPLINQDYGTSETDYVGNYNDLIRHRYNMTSYEAAQRRVDWFTDAGMMEGFKKLITFLLERTNTVNGLRYGDDDTVLAFETGNELNWADASHVSFHRPPPAQWTLEIAQHIKSLAPRTLVMDGSYSRKNSSFWEPAVLDSPYVDLFSYHLYGDGDLKTYPALHKEVRAHGKTLIIGEHGFYPDVATYEAAYQEFDCAGALIWSLRGHSQQGGFDTHPEGSNIFSYHAPGWLDQTSASFDTQESAVVSATYNASYAVLGLDPPPKPVPGTPEVFFVTNGTHPGLSWRGASWASQYEIFGGHLEGMSFKMISNQVQDNVAAGEVFVPLDPGKPTKVLALPARRRFKEVDVPHEGWRDRKWCVPGSACWRQKTAAVVRHANTTMSNNNNNASSSSSPAHNLALLPSFPHAPKLSLLPLMLPSPHKRNLQGAWFFIRALNDNGRHGNPSQALFLNSDWFHYSSASQS